MKRGVCVVLLFLLSACGGSAGGGIVQAPGTTPGSGANSPPSNRGGNPRPSSPGGGVIPQSSITIIPVDTTQVGGVATGTDGSFWYTSPLMRNGLEWNAIVRVTPGGSVTTFYTPSPASAPEGITLASDGNLYAAEEQTGAIVRITPAGQMTEFPVSRSLDPSPNIYQVGTGPDGNVWFIDVHNNTLGEFNIKTGTFSSFSVAAPMTTGSHVITGPNNNLWVSTAPSQHQSGTPFLRYATDGTLLQVYNTYPAPTGFLTTGPDGNVWATAYNTNSNSNGQIQVAIERITVGGSGLVLLPPGNGETYGYLGQIVAGGDGNIYTGAMEGQLLQFSLTIGQIEVYTMPGGCPGDQLGWLAPGPNDTLWAYDVNLNQVYLINLNAL